ncbi:MAG: serine/threonine-protein kinase [Phycisphaerales bacterium]|nr:serine/threonine-protein kinase [Phycisphaerales bacterium]
MTENEQGRARDIFVEAIEMTGEDRRAFIETACVDDQDLKERVERLLLAYDADATNLGGTRETVHGGADLTGTEFGRFRLLQKIGEGGFGEVWMAEQTEPVRRRVAIKIIKPGMDSAQVLARFDAERQALALMEHSNIARIYDGGQTEDGRPYFVMELVKGLPIIEYCSAKKLDLAARLELFRQVCAGVQHAHQKGIIHRDIKPNNVLVGEADGKPVPKVIDFGIAKALERPLTDKTLFTEFRQFVGTPEYMSPEQADLSLIDVDTRSDVYALGVMLYELLAGSPPFDPKSLRSAGFDEMRRIIIEEEPPPPSVRLSQSRDAVGMEEHQHAFERLGRLVRGELDWIVQRAMAKERDHRYSSANELEEDVARYVRGDGVEAGPPARIYRLKRYVRRHRVAAVSLLSVFAGLSLIAVILGISLFVISNKNTELELGRARESAANQGLETSVAQLTLANTRIKRRADAFNLAQVASLSVNDQLQARSEVTEPGGNWLMRMFQAALPRFVENVHDTSPPTLAEIIGPGELLDVSQDGTRALVLNVEAGSGLVHLDLVRLDSGIEDALVSHLVTLPSYESIEGFTYRRIFTRALQALNSDMEVAAFTPDGNRLIVSPAVINLLKSPALGLHPPETPELDWNTRVFSARTGDLLSVIPLELPESLATMEFGRQLGTVLASMNWTCDASGSRVALVCPELLTVHAVDERNPWQENQISRALIGGSFFSRPIMSMSLEGRSVAVVFRGSTWDQNKLCVLKVPNPRETGEAFLNVVTNEQSALWMPWRDSPEVLAAIAGPGHGTRLIESLAFQGEKRLVMLDTANQLGSIELTDPPESAGTPPMWKLLPGPAMDLGMIQESKTSWLMNAIDVSAHKVFTSVRDTNLMVRNGSELIDINLDRRLICGRMSIGRAGATPIWPPASKKAEELLLWTPKKMRRLRLRSAVATLIPGSRSWVPSLIVTRNTRDPLVLMDEIPLERRPMTFAKRRASEVQQSGPPPPKITRRLFAPSGVLESVDINKIRSISPDGRFVVTVRTIEEQPGSGIDRRQAEVTDLLTDDRRVLEHWGTYKHYVSAGERSHCWAEVEGTPVYVRVGMIKVAKDSADERVPYVCTWSALDGSLLSSTPLRSVKSAIANSYFHMIHDSAVSADGRFVAVGFRILDLPPDLEAMAQGSAPLYSGAVFICDRSTGELVDSYELPTIPQRICLSADGSHLAALVATGDDGMEPATLVVYPNRGLDTVKHLLEHVVQSIKLPGSFMMDLRPDQYWTGPTLSFSPDGDLVSVALETSIHLVDVPGRMLVCSFDWTGLVRLLGSESGLSPEVSNTLKSGQPEFQQVLFDGAAFSEDGRELRIGVRNAEIALIRIRDTAWN